MAAQDFASITGTLASLFQETVANNINRSTVLGQVLLTGTGSGKNVQWSAQFGTTEGAVIADGADVSTYNADTKTPAVLQYGTYNDAFSVTGKAMAAAAASKNPLELADLFMDEMKDSANRLSKKLNKDFYAGSGATDNMIGLTASSGGVLATGTYAGIDRAVQTQWQGTDIDAASGPLSFVLIRQLVRTIYTASGAKPDLFVCDPVQHEKLGLLYQGERRYTDTVRIRGQKIVLDGGYNVLEFDGVAVVEDVDAANTDFIALNSEQVRLMQMPFDPRAEGLIPIMGTPEQNYGAGKLPLMAKVNVLAMTGDAKKIQLITYPCIQVRKPHTCGRIKNLAV